jgi:hypothetical protein
MGERIQFYGKTFIISILLGAGILLLLSALAFAWVNSQTEPADNEAIIWYEVTESPSTLTIIETSPRHQDSHVNVEPDISTTFNTEVAQGPAYDTIAVVETETSLPVVIHFKDVDGYQLTIETEKLAHGTTYTVTIPVNAIVALSNDNITLETDYSFSFSTSFAYGDVTGSGNIDVGDAIIILRHIVALADIENLYGSEALIRADVNGDGLIDVSDAILVLRYIVGLISEFPVEQ